MLKNFKLNQTKSIVILLFFFLIQMFCYNYQTILTIHPRTIHAWRQSDCLNFTLNYYNNRATFWEPRVNNISNKGDSKTASDFPLVQYSVAQIWKVFGKSIMLFKLIDVGFLLLGLIYLFKLTYYWTKDFFLSIIISALIYTSPILAYYGPSFINEIQAFGLGFALGPKLKRCSPTRRRAQPIHSNWSRIRRSQRGRPIRPTGCRLASPSAPPPG